MGGNSDTLTDVDPSFPESIDDPLCSESLPDYLSPLLSLLD